MGGIASSATLPSTQRSVGSRSHSTHMRQSLPWRMMLCARSQTWAKPLRTSSTGTDWPATGSGASL